MEWVALHLNRLGRVGTFSQVSQTVMALIEATQWGEEVEAAAEEEVGAAAQVSRRAAAPFLLIRRKIESGIVVEVGNARRQINKGWRYCLI